MYLLVNNSLSFHTGDEKCRHRRTSRYRRECRGYYPPPAYGVVQSRILCKVLSAVVGETCIYNGVALVPRHENKHLSFKSFQTCRIGAVGICVRAFSACCHKPQNLLLVPREFYPFHRCKDTIFFY